MADEERVAAVVILYHPSAEIIGNIKSFYDAVEKIFVFDNSDQESSVKNLLLPLSKVEYYHDFKNEGIATRLNQAARLAIEQGFKWLLTMDQDTCFSTEAIDTYFQCLSSYEGNEQVGMFGTEYDKAESTVSQRCAPQQAENLITSGALLNLSLFHIVGEFDEKLFIDSVDHDYCIRAKLHGFSTVKFSNISIQHDLGTEVFRSSIKTLFLVKKKKKIHPPLRCYYMYRNMLYLEQKYKGQNVYLSSNLRSIVTGNLKASFFYGRQSLKMIEYLMKAKSDFKKNRMGKFKFS